MTAAGQVGRPLVVARTSRPGRPGFGGSAPGISGKAEGAGETGRRALGGGDLDRLDPRGHVAGGIDTGHRGASMRVHPEVALRGRRAAQELGEAGRRTVSGREEDRSQGTILPSCSRTPCTAPQGPTSSTASPSSSAACSCSRILRCSPSSSSRRPSVITVTWAAQSSRSPTNSATCRFQPATATRRPRASKPSQVGQWNTSAP